MKNLVYILILSLPGSASCLKKEKLPAAYADPFTGTAFHGHTFPGTILPFCLGQLSPDTRLGNRDACSDCHCSDSVIFGFSHIRRSGTGCIDPGDVLFHPAADIIVLTDFGYMFGPMYFSQKNEKASPGYYRVQSDNGNISELTASGYPAVHRDTFAEKSRPSEVIDLAHCRIMKKSTFII